jgi:hypothetical protein
LEKKKEEILAKANKWDADCKIKHGMLDEKIENGQKKLKSLLEELEK